MAYKILASIGPLTIKFNIYYKANMSLHHSMLTMLPDPFPLPQRKTGKVVRARETTRLYNMNLNNYNMKCCAIIRIIAHLHYQGSIARTTHEMNLSVVDISHEYGSV